MSWLPIPGVTLIPSVGRVNWGNNQEDYDAVRCLTIFFIPVIPIWAVHCTYTQDLDSPDKSVRHRIPIRMSFKCVLFALVSQWLRKILFLGILFLAFGVLALLISNPHAYSYLVFGVVLSVFGIIFLRLFTDLFFIRDTQIRVVLGRHGMGSSDPVTWKRPNWSEVPDPKVLYNKESFAEAAKFLVSRSEWSRAMWAARLCATYEDRSLGEEWTDCILQHPKVQKGIERVQFAPHLWKRFMAPDAEV